MKKNLMIICMALAPLCCAESFVVEKKQKKTKESKRAILEECVEHSIEAVRIAGDILEEIANLQKEILVLQRRAMDAAVDIVQGQSGSDKNGSPAQERESIRKKCQQLEQAFKKLQDVRLHLKNTTE